MHKCVSRTD